MRDDVRRGIVTGGILAVAASAWVLQPTRETSRTSAFDRRRERLAVMRVVLVEFFGNPNAKRFVLDRTLQAGGLGEPYDDREIDRFRERGLQFEEPLRLSDGSRVFRPTIKGLDKRLVDDWAAHAAPSPTPTDIDALLPIDWMTEANWKALETHVGTYKADLDATWSAFHRKYPGSGGWIHLADVGFSPAGDAALTYAWSVSGSRAGSGHWILLVKRDGLWTIAQTEMTWISQTHASTDIAALARSGAVT